MHLIVKVKWRLHLSRHEGKSGHGLHGLTVWAEFSVNNLIVGVGSLSSIVRLYSSPPSGRQRRGGLRCCSSRVRSGAWLTQEPPDVGHALGVPFTAGTGLPQPFVFPVAADRSDSLTSGK